jgi:hypothetical protein
MARSEYKMFCKPAIFPVMLIVVLISSISLEANAQDGSGVCPCFSLEEVEAMFLSTDQLTANEGVSDCSAEDYSVECKAEVIIWDQDYNVIAQAGVDWSDFDPSRCEYIDTKSNPGVERTVEWPHPAPEVAARACFKIISSVIAKSDTSGKCSTYP